MPNETFSIGNFSFRKFWDEELAKVAQAWADQCNFEHDCNQCRRVGKSIQFSSNFKLGAIIFLKNINLSKKSATWSFAHQIFIQNEPHLNQHKYLNANVAKFSAISVDWIKIKMFSLHFFIWHSKCEIEAHNDSLCSIVGPIFFLQMTS